MLDFSVFLHREAWMSLLTLTLMEIVLGIDNIVFITILADRLPPEKQHRARHLGLVFALATRLALLAGITWIMGLTRPFFSVLGFAVTGREAILIGGGLFLLIKANHEIFDKLEVPKEEEEAKRPRRSLLLVLIQIAIMDIIFSFDSVITAVGMARALPVMAIAVIIAVIVMLVFIDGVAGFVTAHPSMRVLALSFLMLIGVMLVAEGMGQPINKGYIYFAMAFSFVVELINIRIRKHQQPVALHPKRAQRASGTQSAAPV